MGKEIRVLDLPDVHGNTALHHAVNVESIEICEDLLKAGVNPNVANQDGSTPFDIATRKKCEEISRLLRSYGALPSNRR